MTSWKKITMNIERNIKNSGFFLVFPIETIIEHRGCKYFLLKMGGDFSSLSHVIVWKFAFWKSIHVAV